MALTTQWRLKKICAPLIGRFMMLFSQSEARAYMLHSITSSIEVVLSPNMCDYRVSCVFLKLHLSDVCSLTSLICVYECMMCVTVRTFPLWSCRCSYVVLALAGFNNIYFIFRFSIERVNFWLILQISYFCQILINTRIRWCNYARQRYLRKDSFTEGHFIDKVGTMNIILYSTLLSSLPLG